MPTQTELEALGFTLQSKDPFTKVVLAKDTNIDGVEFQAGQCVEAHPSLRGFRFYTGRHAETALIPNDLVSELLQGDRLRFWKLGAGYKTIEVAR